MKIIFTIIMSLLIGFGFGYGLKDRSEILNVQKAIDTGAITIDK